MAFHVSYSDARNSTFNNAGRDQVNMVFGSRDILDNLEPVRMDPSRRAECLRNTRIDILKIVVDWADDTRSKQKMLWIHGLAGSGKSTLSTTIANTFRDSGQLGAFLFFDRDVMERSDPTKVIKTLAHQLGTSDPRIGAAIRTVLDKNPKILMSPLSRQFQLLVLDPLSKVEHLPPTIVIVLDALDECGTQGEREALLAVLTRKFVNLPGAIRTVITSRAENDIYIAFQSEHHILPYELDITSSMNADDILSYFRHRMSLIRTRNRHLQLGPEWPGEKILYQLVQRASGLFVWASTASEFINGHSPRKRLDIILQREIPSSAEASLDALYKTALGSVGEWEDEDFVNEFRDILGTILVARQPLSGAAIDAVLQRPEDMPSIHTISRLACLIQQSPTVRVLHPSFADFLLSRKRCGRDIWFFDELTYQRSLATKCLDRMDVALKRNMCAMTLADDQANGTLPEDISYCCVFWIDHICAIEEDIVPIVDRLHDFLFRHLLHWFEAMSILRRSRDTISRLDQLLKWISTCSRNKPKLLELVHDACRFARTFANDLEAHPLMVYMSALPFTPTNTCLYRTFHNRDLYPSISGGFQHTWSPLLMVLTGHKEWINSVAISSDGRWIVSGSFDQTVRVWDSTSGAEVKEIRHTSSINCVMFSPDGCRIVSGSEDGTVQVWDATSGMKISAMRGHDRAVSSVWFSPDGRHIVSGSLDTTVRVWCATMGTEVLPTIRGHTGHVRSVAFSPHGQHIISGSNDKTIGVWDAQTGASFFPPLHGHEMAVKLVMFSPDGRNIVSSSLDKTIRVWDFGTGTQVSILQHRFDVKCFALSPDGQQIISWDYQFWVWDVNTGSQVSKLLVDQLDALSMCCSPDGRHIITGDVNDTVCIWDALSDEAVLTQIGHFGYVRSITFSPDGHKILSVGEDEIKMWDANTGLEEMEWHVDGVSSAVVFSPSGHQIAAGAKTLQIWDATTGCEVSKMEGCVGVYSVAFSPDGHRVAAGGYDETVRIWDATTGREVLKMEGHNGRVHSVAFSPDGCRIVSGSNIDGTIIIWDSISGTALTSLPKNPNGFKSVAFSVDGCCIISKSCQCKTILYIYDAVSGHQLRAARICDNSLLDSTTIWLDGQTVKSVNGRTIGALFYTIDTACDTSHETSLAVGTWHGQVFVIHFPPALFTIPDTRAVDEMGT